MSEVPITSGRRRRRRVSGYLALAVINNSPLEVMSECRAVGISITFSELQPPALGDSAPQLPQRAEHVH